MFKAPHITLIATAFALCTLTACKGRGEVPTEEADATPDSTVSEATLEDSIEVAETLTPPKKADELFDDFAFAFMKNRYFQKERIAFPLPYNNDGTAQVIEKKDWQFDKMYSKNEIYTLIFDSMKGEKAAKDTTLREVTVEELNLDTQYAKSYKFVRSSGEWRLTSLSNQAMTQSANSDFYRFYHRFATDEDFQLQHINNPLEFSTFDDDAFEMVEGVISAEQFKEFSPELPTTEITNILYGQSYKNSNLRILSLRALSGGMECTMTFKKTDGEWRLTRLEN